MMAEYFVREILIPGNNEDSRDDINMAISDKGETVRLHIWDTNG